MRRFLRHFRDVIITGLLILGFLLGLYIGIDCTVLDRESNLDQRIGQAKWELSR